ncbi:MAG: FixH family protein [Bacteroidota bacterium]
MKINWETRIALFLGAFIVFIGYLVYRTTQVNIDLEADDYYAQEVAYQQQIDKQQNFAALGEHIQIEQAKGEVAFLLPSALKGKGAEGSVVFMRPQDKRMDRNFDFTPDSMGKLLINTDDLVPGNYKVQLDWTSEGTAYFFESSLFVH